MASISSFLNEIRSLVSSVGIFDLLDILIVALIIYALLLHIRSSSAVRIASAIVGLLFATWLTGVVKMRVLNFILTNILEIGVIALVIVFQPELRRLLERIGSHSLLMLTNQRNNLNATEQSIASTVSACETMSREKTGVLLVFERDVPLDDYFKTGTMIDAEISSELLRNLFFTKAALHDGAVIVRRNRIAAAGCVLPLTKSTSISSDLGTRHRAGIGMSESCDAIVVIVSEETGTISVAVGGMLKRGLTPATLQKLLQTELKNQIEEDQTESVWDKVRNWLLNRHTAQEKSNDEKTERNKE